MPGGGEMILIVLAILLLFGGRKIPELMRGLGNGIREFNDAKGKVRDNITDGLNQHSANEGKTTNTTKP